MQLSGPWAGDERGLEVMGKPRNRMSLCLRRGAPNGQTNMNFGASHLIQTSALLKKDSKRQLSGVLTLHAAPKGSADLNSFDFHASPRSEASKSIWGVFSEASHPLSLLLEQAHLRQYEAAAEIIIEQLRETLELTAEDLRRHRTLKNNFESFLDTHDGTSNSSRPSFLLLKDVIHAVLNTLFTHGARNATPDFCDQQAVMLVRAYLELKQEQKLLS